MNAFVFQKYYIQFIFCSFSFLTYSTKKKFQLDLQLQDESGGDLSSFVTNGEWALLGKNTNIFLVDLVIILSNKKKKNNIKYKSTK